MKRIFQLIVLCFFLPFFAFSASPKRWVVKSPDQNTRMELMLSSKGELSYSLSYKNTVVASGSGLGFILSDGQDLTRHWMLSKVNFSSCNEVWLPVWGENEELRDHHQKISMLLKGKQHTVNFECKVFDKGVGFRYLLKNRRGDSILIQNEHTPFNLAADADSWWIPVDYDSYEKLYRCTKVAAIDSVQTPFTIRMANGMHLALHEAALVDYSSMTLKSLGKGSLVSALVPWPDGVKVKAKGEICTPWRTIQLGDNAADLVDSKLILNLNERPKQSFSWVEPQKYVGIWWGMHLGVNTWNIGDKHGATTANTKRHIDFAAQNGFRSVLVEGWNKGWDTWSGWSYVEAYPDYDIRELTRYAKEKGVSIIVHNETSGYVDEYDKAIPAAFDFYRSLGAKVIKTGYVGPIKNGQHHQGQWMVNHQLRVIGEAAKRGICVVAHEVVKPTGLHITWPNLLACESACGQEYNAPWAPENNPISHTLILPFTRLLGGPMDYTPGLVEMTYENLGITNKRAHSTLARELAHYIILYSPIQMACDLPENYTKSAVFPIIRQIPVEWETSTILAASVGEYIAVARRQKGKNCWYVGAATADSPKMTDISLSFLDKEGFYRATIYEDGPMADWKTNPRAISIRTIIVNSTQLLKLNLASGGGALVQIEKLN